MCEQFDSQRFSISSGLLCTQNCIGFATMYLEHPNKPVNLQLTLPHCAGDSRKWPKNLKILPLTYLSSTYQPHHTDLPNAEDSARRGAVFYKNSHGDDIKGL